jgi:hypothetical protein
MSFLSQPISLFTIPPVRSFSGITGYVTMKEATTDSLTITKQPIQQGASITDHVFKNPILFSIQMLFKYNSSQSTSQLSQIYQKLIQLQISFTPFICVTPKRTYRNMLFATLGQTTDKLTENCLSITASFEQAIIVNIGRTTVPASQLAKPASNSATQNVGKKSGLYVLSGGP